MTYRYPAAYFSDTLYCDLEKRRAPHYCTDPACHWCNPDSGTHCKSVFVDSAGTPFKVTVNLMNPEFKFARQWEQLWQQKEITQVFMADKNGLIYDFDGKIVALANAPNFVPPPNAPVITTNSAVQIPPARQHSQNVNTALRYPNSLIGWLNPRPLLVHPNPPTQNGEATAIHALKWTFFNIILPAFVVSLFLLMRLPQRPYAPQRVEDVTDQVQDASQQAEDAPQAVTDASDQVPDTSSASAPHHSENNSECSCGRPNTENDMILCESTVHGSGRWFHYECVGLTDEQAVQNPQWLCEECRLGRAQAEDNDNSSDDDKQSSGPGSDDYDDDDFDGASGGTRKKSNNSGKRKPRHSSASQPKKRRETTSKPSVQKSEDSSAPAPRQIRNDRFITSPSNARNPGDFTSHLRQGTEKHSLSDSFDARPRKRVRLVSTDADLYEAIPPRVNDDDLYEATPPRRNEDDLYRAAPARGNFDEFKASLIRSSRPGDLLKVSYDEDVNISSNLWKPDIPKSSNVQASKRPRKHEVLKKPQQFSTAPLGEGSTTTDNKIKPTLWSAEEKAQVMQLMQDVIDEGKVNHTEKRWKVISDRLSSQHNVDRTETAVKNYWNREGRKTSGIEERKKARSNQLVTGVQSPASRRLKRLKRKAAQKNDISSNAGEEPQWDCNE